MTGPQIITSLRSMALTVEDQTSRYRAHLNELTALGLHFSAVLAYVEGNDPASERVTPTATVAHSYGRGQLFARCVQALRDDGPVLGTSDIVTHCLRHAGIDLNDKLLREDMGRRVISLFKRQEAKGEIVAVGNRGRVKLWRLPT